MSSTARDPRPGGRIQPIHVDRHGGLRPGEQPTARFPVLGGDTADLLVRYLRYRICPEWS